jgi:hypothetical protein
MTAKPHKTYVGAPIGTKYLCVRCKRHLPDTSFKPIYNKLLDQMQRGAFLLHPICNTCRKQMRGRFVKHALYSAELERFWQYRVGRVTTEARKRKIGVFVDHEDLLGLYLEQNGRCALSGVELVPSRLPSMKNRLIPSVDRIDSDGNYTLDNIQIVAGFINSMKYDLSNSNFVNWCKRIVVHQAEKEAALLSALGE